jgi:hypothetical protein
MASYWSAVNHLTCCQRVLALLFLVVGLEIQVRVVVAVLLQQSPQ